MRAASQCAGSRRARRGLRGRRRADTGDGLPVDLDVEHAVEEQVHLGAGLALPLELVGLSEAVGVGPRIEVAEHLARRLVVVGDCDRDRELWAAGRALRTAAT
jgi:hypothetical protein